MRHETPCQTVLNGRILQITGKTFLMIYMHDWQKQTPSLYAGALLNCKN